MGMIVMEIELERPFLRAIRGLSAFLSAVRLVPDQDARRSGVVAVAGVVELGAVGNQAEDVPLSGHFDVAARGGDAVCKFQAAVRGDGNVHEKVDIGNEVPDAHRDGGFAESEQKAVPAAVHELLVQAVADGVAFRAASRMRCGSK